MGTLESLTPLTLLQIRLVLRAEDSLLLPAYKGTTLRGGFGVAFKDAVCVVEHRTCERCLLRSQCAYPYVFETPVPEGTTRMRKYPAAPHPFVFLPPLEEKTRYRAGETLTFDMTLIGRAAAYLPYFIYAFERLGRHRGFGKGRGRFSVAAVLWRTPQGETVPIYTETSLTLSAAFRPATIRDLLPNVPRLVPVLHDVRRVVEQWCRARFGGRLTLDLDWDVTLRGNDFYGKRFRAVLETVRERSEQAKKRKLSAVLMENGRWNDGGAFVLSERYARYQHEGTWESCGEKPAEPATPEDGGMRIGADCRDLRQMGRKLPDDSALVWDTRNADLTFFGDAVGIKLVNRAGLHGVGERIEEINAPDGTFPCRFMATHVPRLEAGQSPGLERPGADEETASLGPGDPLPFDVIAERALRADTSDNGQDSVRRGVADLGVLKGDVDFLGRIFSDGMGEDFSISRYATLSRMLDLFFRGYLETVTTHDFRNTYTVYAGGDDLLLITDWQNALALADRLACDFRAYVCDNPNLTLSIGLAVTKPHFPIRLGAEHAEQCLQKSKDRGRDRLTVFGETVTWRVFREKLEPYFQFLDDNVQSGEFGTAFLYRLLHYHRMHRELQAGKVERAVYRSRLSYDLKRNIEKRDTAGRVTNQAVLDELYRLFDLRTPDVEVMNHLAIPLHWALYRNRQGG